MIFEKKLIVGIAIVNAMIDRYDDNTKDSAIMDEDVIEFCKNYYQCTITNKDFEEMIDILNRTSTRQNFLQRHTYSLPMQFNRIVSTECRKEYLIDIKNQLEEELKRISNIF